MKKNLFPQLKRKINGKPIHYLDNAATTLKPKSVIDAVKKYYEYESANIHRGIYTLSEEATEAYDKTRNATASFINAADLNEIIFTRNTTESINLVAYTWGEKNIRKGSEIIVSELEHHSNLIMWQELCKRKKAKLKIIPIKNDYTLDLKEYEKLLTKKTKLVAITGMSNVTGTIPPLKKIIRLAHKSRALVLVDGAQAVAHSKTDVQALDCDFFAFSGHKMFGPTGVGVLYAKKELLERMPPFLFGGDMINKVTQHSATYNELPYKFEAGTPNIAGVIAFEKAINFIKKIGFKALHKHEMDLYDYAIKKFSAFPQVKLFTPPRKQTGAVLSFTIKNIHPHDIAEAFNKLNVFIRAGHHCAQPLMTRLKTPATARMSFSIYNTKKDIDTATLALKETIKIFS